MSVSQCDSVKFSTALDCILDHPLSCANRSLRLLISMREPNPQPLQELLGVAGNVLGSAIRFQGFRTAEAVKALAEERDEVVCSTLSCVDLEPVA